MSIEVKVPQLPESVTDATLVTWHKRAGEEVRRDENLVDLETDKVVLEVPAPSDGILKEITVADGSTVTETLPVAFSGTASDPEDGDLTPSLAWSSDLDGPLGSGGSFSTSTLSLGTHTITGQATDPAAYAWFQEHLPWVIRFLESSAGRSLRPDA